MLYKIGITAIAADRTLASPALTAIFG